MFLTFHASTMTLFLLSIGCVGHEFIDVVDSVRQLSPSIHWWFQVQQGLYFRWRFMDQPWHSIFHNSMRLPRLYFCYRFDMLFVNLVALSIPYVNCHLVFIDDFKVYRDVVFADDLWISANIAFFDNSLRQPWLYFCYRFDASIVNSLTLWIPYVSCHSVFIDNLKLYRDFVFGDDLWISNDITFLTIPSVKYDSIFAIDLMHGSWIRWRC